MERALYLTDDDYERLELLLDNMNCVPQNRRKDLSRLEEDLSNCHIVAPEDMPAKIVTLHSTVRCLDIESNAEHLVELVFPSNADLSKGRLSIIMPFGSAILGRAEGDTVSWEVFDRKMTICIEEVLHQPEGADDCHKSKVQP